MNLKGAVPCVPAPPEIKGTTLRYADQLRRKVWEQYPYDIRKGASDWGAETRSFPPDPTGCCRHKVRWLQDRIGGVPPYGRRTDKGPNPGMHCVLWLRVGDHGFIVDSDGIWPEQSAPFVADATNKAYGP